MENYKHQLITIKYNGVQTQSWIKIPVDSNTGTDAGEKMQGETPIPRYRPFKRPFRKHFQTEGDLESTSVQTLPNHGNQVRRSKARRSQNIRAKEVRELMVAEKSEPPTTQPVCIKSKRQQWFEEKNFDYFFKTLKDHPVEKIYNVLLKTEIIYPEQAEEEKPLSRKRREDKEWFMNTKSICTTDEQTRRKSNRIEMKQEKEQLQQDMKEMRIYYYQGRYRYKYPEVRFRLSYLAANCDPHDYECQTILNIPDRPIYNRQTDPIRFNRIVQSKRASLQARIVQ